MVEGILLTYWFNYALFTDFISWNPNNNILSHLYSPFTRGRQQLCPFYCIVNSQMQPHFILHLIFKKEIVAQKHIVESIDPRTNTLTAKYTFRIFPRTWQMMFDIDYMHLMWTAHHNIVGNEVWFEVTIIIYLAAISYDAQVEIEKRVATNWTAADTDRGGRLVSSSG